MKLANILEEGEGYMTLTQIYYFLEVCQTMNFTKAAQNLYVAQPSLSRQIQLLETELGVQLIVRSNRNVVLTDAGSVFRDEFERISKDIEMAIHKTKEAGDLKKEINIGLFRGVSPQMIYGLMEKMSNFFEGYKIHVNRYSSYNLKKGMEVGNLDLIVDMEGCNFGLEDIYTCFLEKRKAYFVFSPKLFPEGSPRSIEDFSGKKFICVQDELSEKLVDNQLKILDKLHVVPSKIVKVPHMIASLLYSEAEDSFSVYINGNQEGIDHYPVPDDVGDFKVFALWKKEAKLPLSSFFEENYGFCL